MFKPIPMLAQSASYHTVPDLPPSKSYELKGTVLEANTETEDNLKPVSWIHWSLLAQSFPALLLSTAGFLFTGLIIDIVQHWEVFKRITELFIMIPVLLNLKGNLEMGLATRLSTAANRSEEAGQVLCLTDSVVRGNILLVQFQAILSGFLVGLLSCGLGFMVHHQLNTPSETLLLLATSTGTAFLSSAMTSTLIAVIIVKSRQAKINPDNISTPLANCLGDLSTMCVLALIAQLLFSLNSPLISAGLLVGSLVLSVVLGLVIHGIESVRSLIWEGWSPVLSAIMISSIAGLAFERFVRYFEGLGLILTVVNGVCGNISSILAARMATSLQLDESIGSERERYQSAKRTLLFLATPIQLIFLLILHVTELGHTSVTPMYVIGHLLASNIHLALILVWLTPNLVRLLWSHGLDPDTYTLPLLAASSDLSGTFIFILTFTLLWLLGDRDANVGT